MGSSLPLILACDAGYAPGVAVALWSARRFLRRSVMLDARVFDGGLAPGDAAALEEALRRAGGPYRLSVVPAPALPELRKGRTKDNTVMWARICIPEVFSDLDRALYLDADVIVRRDLAELLDLPFDGAIAYAVRDVWIRQFDGPGDKLPLQEYALPPEAPYFNSGVFWFDVAAWRTQGLAPAVFKLASERAGTWQYPDQSVLNVILHNRWRELDASWNRQLWVEEDRWQITPPGPAIVHINSCKPWLFPLDRPAGVVRMFARCLHASGWLEHRQPLPKYRNLFPDGPAQRLREGGRWACEIARRIRRRLRKRNG